MAKQVGLFGNWTGKLANTVGYNLANSRNRVAQGVRAYQPTVANPKSDSQSNQRMKMAPATNFYRAFTDPIDHSFEGKKVGGGSRQEFMKYALKEGFTTVPAVVKGTTAVVPGKYLVSKGSLSTHVPSLLVSSKVVTDIYLSAAIDAASKTWGEVSLDIINNNLSIKDGDELCFMALYDDAAGSFIPTVNYVVLDTQSDQTLEDLGGNYAALSSHQVGSLYMLAGGSPAAISQGLEVGGGAIIVSRRPRKAGGTWLRSNSRMRVSAAVDAAYFTSEAYQRALASYGESAGSFDSDLTLNQAGADAEASVAPSADVVNKQVTIDGTQYTLAYSNIAAAPGVIFEEVRGQDMSSTTYGFTANLQTQKLTRATPAISVSIVEWGDVPHVTVADFLAAAPGWSKA